MNEPRAQFSQTDRAATVLIALVGVMILWFGMRFHDIPATATAERDRFVEKADELRDGKLPVDPYRPLLYPILAAGAGELLDDTFSGARLVSQLAAIALLLVTYRIGRATSGGRAGLVAVAFLALNGVVIENAVLTTTDMLFSAFSVATVLAAVHAVGRAGRGPVIWLALWFSLAFFTRYAVLGLLPCVAIALLVVPGGVKRSLLRCAGFAVCCALFLTPHFVLNAKVHGDPFHHANVENLLGKLYGGEPAERVGEEVRRGTGLSDESRDGSTSVSDNTSAALEDPTPLIRSAIHLAREYVASDFGAIAGNWRPWLGAIFTGLLALGVYAACVAWNARRAVLLAAFFGSLALVFLSKLSMPRTLLPTLPLAYLFIADFLSYHAFAGTRTFARLSVAPGPLLVLILLLLEGRALVAPIVGFLGRHPHAELEAARELERAHGSAICIAGTYDHTDRVVRCRFHFLPLPRSGESERLYFDSLAELLRERRVDYVVVGRNSRRHRPDALWSGIGLPEFLAEDRRTEDFVVYRCRHGEN